VSDEVDMDRLNAELHEAIAGVLAKHGRMMLNRALVLAETIEEDGDRAMWIGATPGTKSWDTYGLLRAGLAVEDAATARGEE
jgi:hypothetical protein